MAAGWIGQFEDSGVARHSYKEMIDFAMAAYGSMPLKRLEALPLIIASFVLAGCGPRIGCLSNYEVADEIAKEQGPKKAEEWLRKVVGPEKAQLWREEFDSAVGREQDLDPQSE